MPDPRLSRLSAAFRDTPLSLGGRELRRPTAGTIALLMELQNPLFTAGEEGGELDDTAAMRGVIEFAWVHVAEIDELEALPLDPAELRAHVARKVRGFGMGIDFEDLQAFSASFASLRERLESAATEPAEAAPATPGKPGESPPTGLPGWSTLSEVLETPPESGTSSGTSPSSAPSSISTPPTSTTAAPSAGPAPPPATPEEEMDPMPVSSS